MTFQQVKKQLDKELVDIANGRRKYPSVLVNGLLKAEADRKNKENAEYEEQNQKTYGKMGSRKTIIKEKTKTRVATAN